jgi:hypothetical protein
VLLISADEYNARIKYYHAIVSILYTREATPSPQGSKFSSRHRKPSSPNFPRTATIPNSQNIATRGPSYHSEVQVQSISSKSTSNNVRSGCSSETTDRDRPNKPLATRRSGYDQTKIVTANFLRTCRCALGRGELYFATPQNKLGRIRAGTEGGA